MKDPAIVIAFAPVLLLAALYSQALLTMEDDEFFSSRINLSSLCHERYDALRKWSGVESCEFSPSSNKGKGRLRF